MRGTGLRIVAGSLRGRRISAPQGRDTRPTPDRVREALFSILMDRVPGSRFLDLYSGSGAIGIEAFSRGAEAVVLVENGRAALCVVKKNLESLGIAGAVRLIDVPWPEARRRAAAEGGPFTIVFADPPYDEAPYPEILESLPAPGLLAANPVVVLEHESGVKVPDEAGGLKLSRDVVYGRVALAFYVPAG